MTASPRRWRRWASRCSSGWSFVVTRPSSTPAVARAHHRGAARPPAARRVIGVDGEPSMIDAARERLGERPGSSCLWPTSATSTAPWARRRGAFYGDVPLDLRPRAPVRRACAASCVTAGGSSPCGGAGNIEQLHAVSAALAATEPFAPHFDGHAGPWRFAERAGDRGPAARGGIHTGARLAVGLAGGARGSGYLAAHDHPRLAPRAAAGRASGAVRAGRARGRCRRRS